MRTMSAGYALMLVEETVERDGWEQDSDQMGMEAKSS